MDEQSQEWLQWLDKQKALLLRKEAERSNRQKKEWQYLENGFGRHNVYSNRGKK